MIDIHSHVVYGVDDGPSTIKESIRMVLEAEKLGVKGIIATAHFHENLYHPGKLDEHFKKLVSRTFDCGVKLYPGYEVFLTPLVCDIIKENKFLTLNKSKYLLFELPLDTLPLYAAEVLYRLHLEDIVPIIAHPERNRYFAKNINGFLEFLESGCLVQVDAASIIGVYGPEIKRFAKRLIKLDMAHFVASDAHCAGDYTEWYLAAYRLVKRWGGEEYAGKLFEHNAKMILDNLEGAIVNEAE